MIGASGVFFALYSFLWTPQAPPRVNPILLGLIETTSNAGAFTPAAACPFADPAATIPTTSSKSTLRLRPISFVMIQFPNSKSPGQRRFQKEYTWKVVSDPRRKRVGRGKFEI